MVRRIESIVILTLAAIVGACGRSEGPSERPHTAPVVKARVETAQRTPLETQFEAVGTVRSKTVSTIQSRIVGNVTAVHVKEGDHVTSNALLIEIDDRDAAAQKRKAESSLAEAHSALQEAGKAISAGEAAKDAADANSQLANTTYERYKGLLDSRAVSQQVFDEADAKRKATVAAATQAADMLGSYHSRKAAVEARIEQAKAELANAQNVLSYSRITSPIDGIVTMKNVDVGDQAAPGVRLLDIEDNQQYRLEATVVEALVGHLRTGDPAIVIIDALGGTPLTGTVAETVPAADPASRSFIVKIDLPKTESLRSGMFGRVRFAIGRAETLTVPASVIVERGQLTGVYVVNEDNVARLRLIKTGQQVRDRLEVLSGLNPGESYVADNMDAITDGCRVEKP